MPTLRHCRLLAPILLALTALSHSMPIAGADPDPVLEGVYTYQQDGAPPSEWTVFPTCVPTVGDLREPLELPIGCTLHIASTGDPRVYRLGRAGDVLLVPGGDARMTSGQWSYTALSDSALLCGDGTRAKAYDTVEFDGIALRGTRTTRWSEVCGLNPGSRTVSFTLIFKEPLPFPVDRYPLDCEADGLRRCS